MLASTMKADDGKSCSVRVLCVLCVLFIVLALPSTVAGRLQESGRESSAQVKRNVNQSHPISLSTADYEVFRTYNPSPCSSNDILISQGASAPLPSGIPTYTVVIMNACVGGSSICNIHVKCGWFSTARLINPGVFKRLGYDDCLVNGGNPVHAGGTISFQYAQSFKYPLSVSSVICC